jgi:hypothetical protein
MIEKNKIDGCIEIYRNDKDLSYRSMLVKSNGRRGSKNIHGISINIPLGVATVAHVNEGSMCSSMSMLAFVLLMISRDVMPFSVVVTWMALTPYCNMYAFDCITGSMGSNDENVE